MRIKDELMKLLLIDTIGIGSAYVAAAIIEMIITIVKENKRK